MFKFGKTKLQNIWHTKSTKQRNYSIKTIQSQPEKSTPEVRATSGGYSINYFSRIISTSCANLSCATIIALYSREDDISSFSKSRVGVQNIIASKCSFWRYSNARIKRSCAKQTERKSSSVKPSRIGVSSCWIKACCFAKISA